VLPLQNLSRDPEQEYFADGMTDALITDLGKIGALRVISRQSIMRYKGSKVPLPEIARELKVDAVVEGSVQRSGDRIRVTAQLLDGKTDRHLWAESYERDFRDVLKLQSEVAQAVAREIRITLTPEERRGLEDSRRVHPEAYRLYLQGRHQFNKRTVAAFETSIKLFHQALENEPDSALAYAGLAESYGILPFYEGAGNRRLAGGGTCRSGICALLRRLGLAGGGRETAACDQAQTGLCRQPPLVRGVPECHGTPRGCDFRGPAGAGTGPAVRADASHWRSSLLLRAPV
jgi:TolB-like protein